VVVYRYTLVELENNLSLHWLDFGPHICLLTLCTVLSNTINDIAVKYLLGIMHNSFLSISVEHSVHISDLQLSDVLFRFTRSKPE